MKGLLFDLQRFALHDGPGIRTAVFLKGCPFKCVWCCNPESIDPEPQLAFDESKCIQCHKCVNVCSYNAIIIEGSKLKIDYENCTKCGECITACPTNALKIYGYDVDSSVVIEEVLKDSLYYKNSGGGLTLSGGDPLFQFDFALELLKKAKDNGLNTCLETEGFATREQFDKILPYVDYFYYDYKITDDFLHNRYTGVSNKSVIENLNYICKRNAFVVLRCVIIPEINDNDNHFKAIAHISKKYKSVTAVHIMPYHNYGEAKYKQIGKTYFLAGKNNVTKEVALGWVERVKAFGGKNVSIG